MPQFNIVQIESGPPERQVYATDMPRVIRKTSEDFISLPFDDFRRHNRTSQDEAVKRLEAVTRPFQNVCERLQPPVSSFRTSKIKMINPAPLLGTYPHRLTL